MKRYLPHNLCLSFAIVMLFCSGCSRHGLDVKRLINKSPEELYQIGKTYSSAKKTSDAVLAFEEIEKSHPYSKYVADSQVEAGICYFKMKKYDDAVAMLDGFIQTHPTHNRVPEALYLLGCIYYDQMPIVKRDQENTMRSFEYLSELCSRYPTNKYVIDAKKKIDIILQHLALHEFRVGMYYQKHKNFPAAISRYNTIIESYPTTESAQEAYLRLIECYLSKGMNREATEVNRVLQNKHKESKWAKYATKKIPPK